MAAATSLLKLSGSFAKPLYAVGSLVLFGILFYLLAIFRHIPMGIAYAIRSEAGIVLISAIAYFLCGKSLICPQSSP